MVVKVRAALGDGRRWAGCREIADALIFATLQPLILPTPRARVVRNEMMHRIVESVVSPSIDTAGLEQYERRLARFGDALVDNDHPLAQPCSALARTLRNIIADVDHAKDHVEALRDYLRQYLTSVNARATKRK